jgi:hypothetical protein
LYLYHFYDYDFHTYWSKTHIFGSLQSFDVRKRQNKFWKLSQNRTPVCGCSSAASCAAATAAAAARGQTAGILEKCTK